MSYWDTKSASRENLRLYVPNQGWRKWEDELTPDGQTVTAEGSAAATESALLNLLNCTNLIVLTGAGSSLCAKNAPGKLPAPTMGDLWDAVKQAVGEERFTAALSTFTNNGINENIERLLTLCKIFLELNENAAALITEPMKSFVRDAERTILARVGFVDRDTPLPAHSLLIQKIGRRGIRKPRTKIFTTNYDLCFEEAARRQRFVSIDGFSHTLDQVYDRSNFDLDIVRRNGTQDAPNFFENVFHLYKLHGSVDWRRKGNEVVRSQDQDGEPVLIFPRSSKYQESFEAPYLDLIGAFQAALREPDTGLLVCGFGFNDDHISRPILAAVESNLSLRLAICDPRFVTEASLLSDIHQAPPSPPNPNQFLLELFGLVDAGDPRLHFINARFEDLAVAVPDLVGETDRERHAARVKALKAPKS